MKFDVNEESNVEQVGDIKNNSVSIDVNNIDFIVTILSTNLYSKPIESFIRETVSNAWDSHKEAGVDDPVVMELGIDPEGQEFCRIQDFGVGLSPDRFEKVYKNIGSSTKRSDNKQIGGFGIGRFSALAYSNVVHITSCYDGQRYQYMMYKDGNSVAIDLLNTIPTDERNGLEVKLQIKTGDYQSFVDAIKSQLVYFENLYVTSIKSDKSHDWENGYYENIEEKYNTFKIKKYRTFWVNSLDTKKELNLVLGKVRYPIRLSNLKGDYSSKVEDYPISLYFNIGDLSVTPNREEILYSDENIETIEKKLILALEEIDELTAAAKATDYTDVPEYLEAIGNTMYLDLLQTPDEGEHNIRIKLTQGNRFVTLQGHNFDEKGFAKTYKEIMTSRDIVISYTLRNGMIKYQNMHKNINNLKDNFGEIYIGRVGDFKNITKRYIRENFEEESWFIEPDKNYVGYYRQYFKHCESEAERQDDRIKRGYSNSKDKYTFEAEAFRFIFNYLIGNFKKLPKFGNNSVGQKWIDATKAADKAKRGVIKKAGFDWKQNINVHVVVEKDYGRGLMTVSTPFVMSTLSKHFGKLAVYGDRDCPKMRALYEYCKSSIRPAIMEIAPTKMKLVKEVDNFVNIEDFMDVKYPIVRNIGTVEYLKRNMPHLEKLAKLNNIGEISPKLAAVVKELSEFTYKYGNQGYVTEEKKALVADIYDVCEGEKFFNKKIVGLFKKNEKELMNARLLVIIGDGGYSLDSDIVNLTVDYVLSRKLIRPSVAAVKKLKTETIFNIIPEPETKEETDESNSD
jgi:hypothetical protein